MDTYLSFRTDDETARYLNQFSRLERFGFDYRHFLTLPDHHAALIHGSEYADMRTEFPPHPQPEETQRAVETIIHDNTWRYATPDTSAESPFVVGKPAELDLLETLAREGPMTQGQLQIRVPKHRTDLWEILDKVERQGFVLKRKDGRFLIVELGREELRKYDRPIPPSPGFPMQGGEQHDLTLERARRSLTAQGCDVGPRILQEVGQPSPDFRHTLQDGTRVLDEVEHRASHPDQIRRNYEKAQGKPVWFWATNLDTAKLIVDALGDRPNYRVYVDQGESFSRYGPGVPKEEEPISEEQDLVELAIARLIQKGLFVLAEKRQAVSFQEIVQSLPKPLPYQKVRAVLEKMVGVTVFAIRERRPEQGGPLVILRNDAPEDGMATGQPAAAKPIVIPDPEPPAPDNDDEMTQAPSVARSAGRGLPQAAIPPAQAPTPPKAPPPSPTPGPKGGVWEISQSLGSPSPEPTVKPPPSQSVGRDLMVQNLVSQASQLLAQGRVLSADGKKAVRVSDLCTFYHPWTETEMGRFLTLLSLQTTRIWLPTSRSKVTVWFAWGDHSGSPSV